MSESKLIQTLKRINNVRLKDLEAKGYLPLLCRGQRVGTVPLEAIQEMKSYPNVFSVEQDHVSFHKDLNSYQSLSDALANFLKEIREKKIFKTLSGWRNECYEVRTKFSSPALLKVERSATPLLGMHQYGVHINGYVQNSEKEKSLWIQKRSKTKQTFPGKYDSFVGGGYSEGLGIIETAVKELEEEAGLVLAPGMKLQPCGSVSFLHMSERGLNPQTEFVFDLRLPDTFKPCNQDGEVEDFKLVEPRQLLELIKTEDYKTTSIPIALDWLIRHGELTVEEEPDISQVLSEIHQPLYNLYS